MTAAAGGSDTFPVFGTTAVLLTTDPAAIGPARALADAELAAVDRAASRFRPDSELTALNAAAGTPVTVSPLLASLIEAALRAARLTAGAVDPTCGQALADLGYDRDFAQLRAAQEAPTATQPGASVPAAPRPAAAGAPTDPGAPAPRAAGPTGDPVGAADPDFSLPAATDLAAPAPAATRPAGDAPAVTALAGPVPGWRGVEFDAARRQVRMPPGTRLDLGATAKAWAADRCAELIAAKVGGGVLVSLGGDIAVAGPAPEGGWRVRVTDDHAGGPDAPGQTVSIATGGLATSSTTVRAWSAGGRRLHHIIDPATGQPAATCWRTVSVVAATCVDANTASTAAIVRGPAAPTWLSEAGLPSRLVRPDGTIVLTAGWPDDERLGGSPSASAAAPADHRPGDSRADDSLPRDERPGAAPPARAAAPAGDRPDDGFPDDRAPHGGQPGRSAARGA
jgi:thiamine biosynthesis lipoprotein